MRNLPSTNNNQCFFNGYGEVYQWKCVKYCMKGKITCYKADLFTLYIRTPTKNKTVIKFYKLIFYIQITPFPQI